MLMNTESKVRFDLPDKGSVDLTQETDFPSNGNVLLRVEPEKELVFKLHLRIPPYAEGATLQVGDGPVMPVEKGDFAVIEREWHPGDCVRLDLPFPVTIHANQDVAAVQRGPLVYAYFQKAQNDPVIFLGRRGVYPDDVLLHLDPADPCAGIQETPAREGLLGPGLLVPGYRKAKAPIFAGTAGNAQLDGQTEDLFSLLPFANQGALRGDYQVFMYYQKPPESID